MQVSLFSGLFIAILCMMGSVLIAANPSNAQMGCYIIGSEINGDNTVEYLGIGNC